MTNNAYVLVYLLIVLISCAASYWLGFYTHTLKDTISGLKASKTAVHAPEPSITMGQYMPANENAEGSNTAPVGIAESKTPQRIDFETTNAIEKEGRGF